MEGILQFLIYFFLSLFGLSGNNGFPESNGGLNGYVIKKEIKTDLDKLEMVNRFYDSNHHQLFWFSLDREGFMRRQSLIDLLNNCKYFGLDKNDYHDQDIRDNLKNLFLPGDSTIAMQNDRVFTDAALHYGIDLFRGTGMASLINSDEISPKYITRDENFLVSQLLKEKTSDNLNQYISSLEPTDSCYLLLKSTLKMYIDSADIYKVSQLASSINQYRWIHHNKFNQIIVVNIPSASLKYFVNDSVMLTMKVVVGRTSNRTPRFAAYTDQLILFPYWNVPYNIAVKEYLPLFKKTPSMVDVLKMQILDSKGSIIPAYKVSWSLYSKDYFPLRMRQSTGCDNALGVLKFNLTSPYDVYMHDTNFKTAFNSNYRFYSHGCIRLEKPFELADFLLKTPLDRVSCVDPGLKQSPKSIPLENPVPVFVVYMTAEVSGNQVLFFPDIYKILK